MLESISNLEQLSKGVESCKPFELSDVQMSYLKELDVPSEQWREMSPAQQESYLVRISDRFEDLGIDDMDLINSAMEKTYSPDILETFHNRIEMAPTDMEQIEQVSDVLSEMPEFKFENWERLDIDERISALNKVEYRIAEIEHRTPCPVYAEYMGEIQVQYGQVYGSLGGYSPETKDITLNAALLENNEPILLRETLDTLVHEGRHAYQDYNVNACEIHPRHSEVISWSDTMKGGKWGYYGDTSTLIGQRLYEQQSVEIDARNFATDVLDKYNDKVLA